MTTFTFTSEDLEKVNEGKNQRDKIFPRIHNVRIAEGLMLLDGITPDATQVQNDFMRDATRVAPVVLKTGQHSEAILKIDNVGSNKAKVEPMVQERVNSLVEKGLSQQQVNDFKFMTNQANIGSIVGEFFIYFEKKDIFADPEKRGQQIQYTGGSLAQLEISETPPDNEAHLTYKTATRITLDKKKKECHYSDYGMCASYEIASKDNMIIIAEVNLGPLGAENYTPKVTCSISAEGQVAEDLLKKIKEDIPANQNQKSLSSKTIKAQYEEIVVKTLQMTGFEDIFRESVKNDINLILSQGYISPETATNKSKLGAIKGFKSTPKLFAEALVDKIDEAIKKDTAEARKQAIQDLSKNASVLINQPRGYMNILIKNIAQDRATKAGQELPKEKFIQRCKDKINLIFAKFQSKTASQNITIIREANKAKPQALSR